MLLEDRRRPLQLQQRVVQRAHGVGIADDRLHAEDVLHEAAEVPQLLVGVDQVIEAEDRVDHLVPDLLLRLDPADQLVDAPLVHPGRLVLDDVGDEAGAAPGAAVVIPQPPQLPRAEVEVGLRIQIAGRDALHQREALLRRLHLADDDALQRVGGVEERLAQQLADAVQLLLAVPDHPRERGADVGQARAAELEHVDLVGRRLDAAPHRVEIAHQLVDVRLVGHEPERRGGMGEGHGGVPAQSSAARVPPRRYRNVGRSRRSTTFSSDSRVARRAAAYAELVTAPRESDINVVSVVTARQRCRFRAPADLRRRLQSATNIRERSGDRARRALVRALA